MEWLSANGIELAMLLLTLVTTCVGWIAEHMNAARMDKERKHDIKLLTEQVQVLQKQSESLKEQTDMYRSEFNKPPFSDVRFVTDSIRQVEITGSRRVYVDSVTDINGNSYDFRVLNKIPDVFEPTETIEYISGPGPIAFRWRWEDEPNMELRTLRRTLYKPHR